MSRVLNRAAGRGVAALAAAVALGTGGAAEPRTDEGEARALRWVEHLAVRDVEIRRVARLNLAALAPHGEAPLIDAVRREGDEDLRTAPCTPALAARWNAALALGTAGGPAAVEPLRERVRDARESVPVRAFAAISLGRIGDPSAIPDIAALAGEADDGTAAPAATAPALAPEFARQAACAALGAFPSDAGARAALSAIATDRAAPTSRRALSLLALGPAWSDPDVAAPLLAALQGELDAGRLDDWLPFHAAALSLGSADGATGQPGAASLLTELSGARAPAAVRRAAALALARAGTDGTALREAARAQDSRVRAAATLALCAGGAATAQEARDLLRACGQDPEGRRLACAAMGYMAETREDLLVAAQRDLDQRVRAEAVRALGAAADERAREDLARIFRSGAPFAVKAAVLDVLGDPAAPGSQEILAAALTDPSDPLRWIAASACAGEPGRDLQAALARGLADRCGDVREQACLALGRAGLSSGGPSRAVRGALERCAGSDEWDLVRAAARAALDAPSDPEARRVLDAAPRTPFPAIPPDGAAREISLARRTLLARLLQAVPDGAGPGGSRAPTDSMQRPDGSDPSQKYDLGELAWMLGVDAVKPDPLDPASDLRYDLGPLGYGIGPAPAAPGSAVPVATDR